MMTRDAFICDAARTPIGRYGGVLAGVRTDDLGAVPLRALMARNPGVDWSGVDDVYYGCANQAGEDNRNVARISALLAGLPLTVPGMTLNRLCGSGMDAIGSAARAIRCAEASLVLAGGVESMSRAPFVMPKADSAFSREAQIYDTTLGWRFVNPLIKAQYGVDSMPETGENVAAGFGIARADLADRGQHAAGDARPHAGAVGVRQRPGDVDAARADPRVVDTGRLQLGGEQLLEAARAAREIMTVALRGARSDARLRRFHVRPALSQPARARSPRPPRRSARGRRR